MNYKEFREVVRDKNWPDVIWCFFICFGAFAGSIYSFIHTYNDSSEPQRLFIFSFLLFAVGIYGLFELPGNFKIITVASTLSADRKKIILNHIETELKLTPKQSDTGYYTFTHKWDWWASDYDIYLFYDDKGFYFMVKAIEHYGRGIFDFGTAAKFRRKMKAAIERMVG